MKDFVVGLVGIRKDLQGFVKGSCASVFKRSSKELQGFVLICNDL